MRKNYFLLSMAIALPVWGGAAYVDFLEPPATEGLVALFVAVVLFPVLEEWVFRGLLWDLWDHLKSQEAGLVSTLVVKNCCVSACFSLLHTINYGVFGAALVFIPSLWLGWVRERSDSVPLCCLVHVCWNAGYVAATLVTDNVVVS